MAGYQRGFATSAQQLRAIFGNQEDISVEAQQPIVRLYSHRSGAVLRLQGFACAAENSAHFTVLIELGETDDLLRERLRIRYYLSQRQSDLLMLRRRGWNNRQIAARFGTSPSALKSSLRELRLKLDLPDGASLRGFSGALSPDRY